MQIKASPKTLDSKMARSSEVLDPEIHANWAVGRSNFLDTCLDRSTYTLSDTFVTGTCVSDTFTMQRNNTAFGRKVSRRNLFFLGNHLL